MTMDEVQPDRRAGHGGLCYVLFCFRSREYVSYLLASLYRTQDLFLVHCDSRAPDLLKAYLESVSANHPNIVRLETLPYSWAGFSHVDICLRAVKQALELADGWAHLLFLSEQHLPLKSPSDIEGRLEADMSSVVLTVAAAMSPEAQADIHNRFGALYRELPDVGCFAIGLADRDPDFYDHIYHGSNWIALCRRHCRCLIEADEAGEFDLYQSIVHAEEVAIQSILAKFAPEIIHDDVTLVAAPHLVDNSGLVMTDDLFMSGIASGFSFIRKRTRILSASVDAHIRSRHFEENLFRPESSAEPEVSLPELDHDCYCKAVVDDIIMRLKTAFPEVLDISVVDPKSNEFTCRIHILVRRGSMRVDQSIRILSQDTRSFKICLVNEAMHQLAFPAPAWIGDSLHASIRVKLNGFFGFEDILPSGMPGAGFVFLDEGGSLDDIVSAVKFLIARTAREGCVGKMTDIEAIIASKESSVRADRINRLIKISGAKRYLEIGVAFGDTFFRVHSESKTAVDPNFRFDWSGRKDHDEIYASVPSDEFFQRYAGGPFDMIYLDGLHTFEQTARDFFNSFCLAHDKTVWLLDDTLPSDSDAALPDQAECYRRRAAVGNPDASWMGDVFKTVLLIGRVIPALRYKTFEGHGQTVVWKAQPAQEINTKLPSLEAIATVTFETLMASPDMLNFDSDENIYDAITRDLVG